MHSRSRDALPTPRGFEEVYQADYFAECEGFPICVVEIKKPDAKDDLLEGDARKLPSMLKLSLDRLLDAGVESPVVGLLVEGELFVSVIESFLLIFPLTSI